MPNGTENKMLPQDLEILRSLARRKMEIAADPLNLERKRIWYLLDSGRPERPMILTEPGVAFAAMPDSQLQCKEEWARQIEWGLRLEIFQFEKICDDHVVEPWINTNWMVHFSDFGLEVKHEYADRVSGNVSSRRWLPPIQDLATDLDKMKPRMLSVDREGTFARKILLEDAFNGVVPVRIRGGFWWTLGMTWTAIDHIGLENLMLYMCTEPEGLHRLMTFLRDDILAMVDWLEKENLLSLNNENDYIGSGSMGYTHHLPGTDWKDGDPVCARHLWTLCESQETVSVGPDMFEEFVFQYQKPIMERFGGVYYGCCEPLQTRWHILKRVSNLRRVSISPWCDQEFMAEALGRNYVFSRKSNPALVSTDNFDENAIRSDIANTVQIAKGCNLEIILKDVHTLAGEPERIARWVQIAKEQIMECYLTDVPLHF